MWQIRLNRLCLAGSVISLLAAITSLVQSSPDTQLREVRSRYIPVLIPDVDTTVRTALHPAPDTNSVLSRQMPFIENGLSLHQFLTRLNQHSDANIYFEYTYNFDRYHDFLTHHQVNLKLYGSIGGALREALTRTPFAIASTPNGHAHFVIPKSELFVRFPQVRIYRIKSGGKSRDIRRQIFKTCHTKSWDDNGGENIVEPISPNVGLIIKAPLNVHRLICSNFAHLITPIRNLPSKEPTAEYAALWAKQFQSVSVVGIDETIRSSMRSLASNLGMTLRIEDEELLNVGLDVDQPYDMHIENVPLHTFNEVFTVVHSLVITVDRSAKTLTLTTIEGLDDHTIPIRYPLLGLPKNKALTDDLSDVIQKVVSPESWMELGGGSSISTNYEAHALLIDCPPSVHLEVSKFLDSLNRLLN